MFLACLPSENIATKRYFMICPPSRTCLGNIVFRVCPILANYMFMHCPIVNILSVPKTTVVNHRNRFFIFVVKSRDGKSIGPLVPEKNLIPRKYYPRKNKIVIIY